MRKYLQIVDRHKASAGIRFANFFLDRIFIQVIYYSLIFIFAVIYAIIYGEELDTENNTVTFVFVFMYLAISFSYFYFMEYYLGKTIAKFITSTKVISIDGNKPTPKQIIARTFSRAVPFDSLSFLGQNGWHDSWSDTRVIDIKNYEAEKQTKSDIDSLGNKEIS